MLLLSASSAYIAKRLYHQKYVLSIFQLQYFIEFILNFHFSAFHPLPLISRPFQDMKCHFPCANAPVMGISG
jgi:hypothetical protein